MTEIPKDEVIRLLRQLQAMKPGDPAPAFLLTPNAWVDTLAQLCGRAADIIEQLEETLFEEQQGDGI